MKKFLAALLIVVLWTSVTVLSFAEDSISKLTGVWLYENEEYINIISIKDNKAISQYFYKEKGTVSDAISYSIFLDPDNANRIIGIKAHYDLVRMEIWNLLEDGTLNIYGEIYTKK